MTSPCQGGGVVGVVLPVELFPSERTFKENLCPVSHFS